MAETIHYIRRNSDYFPLRFEGLSDVPEGLYCIGSLPDDNIPSVAVVGARSCSSYGRKTAFALGKFLAEHGVQVISGMAMGIDSSAQEGALAAGGKTFAVLGCGVDICYPRTSYAVYDALAVRGGIIAEVEPGTKPLAYNFPRRNRIISHHGGLRARAGTDRLCGARPRRRQTLRRLQLPDRAGSRDPVVFRGCDGRT